MTERNGLPASGATVTFLSPDTTESGTFPESIELPTVIQAVTDADGRSSARFKAAERPGVFLVSVIVDRTEVRTTFAISVTDAPEPALSAAAARTAIESQLTIARSDLQVHGPFLLPAGSLIRAAGIGTAEFPTQPFSVDRTTWFFWIDDAPGAGYQHPVRFVSIDAEDTSPDIAGKGRISREGWWPTVLLPSPRFMWLLPPVSDNRQIGPIEPEGIAGLLRKLSDRFAGRFAEPDPGLCAISVHGPRERAHRTDVSKMRRFFHDTIGVPEDQIFNARDENGDIRPLKKSDLDKFVAMVLEKNCKKVYFHFSGHGFNGGVAIGSEDDTDNYFLDGTKIPIDGLYYTELATKFEPLAQAGVKVCFIIASCSSGSAISDLNNHGLMGEVITAAGRTDLAYFADDGYRFIADFIKCFMELQTATNSNPTFVQVRDWIAENGQERTNVSMPQATTVFMQVPAYPGPTVLIPDPAAGPVTLRLTRPEGTTGEVSIRLEIADPGIATFPNNNIANFRIPAGQNDVTIPVTGIQSGVTNYSIRATDANLVQFTGMGRIEVGKIFIEPAPIDVVLGGTAGTAVTRNAALAINTVQVFRIVAKDLESSRIAQVAPAQGVLAPNVTRFQLGVRGLMMGTATFLLIDPQTGIRLGEFQVRVNGVFTDREFGVMVGETVRGKVLRSNANAPVLFPVTITPVDTESAMIASVGPQAFQFGQDQTEVNINIMGLKVGVATFEVFDQNTGSRWRFTVRVSAKTSCLPQGSHQVQFAANTTRDPALHNRVLSVAQVQTIVMIGPEGAVSINSNNPLIGNLSGTMTPSCLVEASGRGMFGSTPIANQFYGEFLAGQLSGYLTLGNNGELPGMRTLGTDEFLHVYDRMLGSRRMLLYGHDGSTSRIRAWNSKVVGAGASGTGNVLPGFPWAHQFGGAVDGKVFCLLDDSPNGAGPFSGVSPIASFEPNRGQTDRRVDFLARNLGYGVYLSKGQAWFALLDTREGKRSAAWVRMRLEGARRVKGSGAKPNAGVSAYLKGARRSQWISGIPHYGRVEYRDVNPGIDLVFYGAGRELEYDVIVRPGADPSRVILAFDGARSVELDPNGDARLTTAAGPLVLRRPHVYQHVDGEHRVIRSRYVAMPEMRLGFEIDAYDPSQPLVIDPVVDLASYLGGSGTDIGQDIAIDGPGNIYVAGFTASANFPSRPGGFQTALRGAFDVFVTKFAAGTGQLVYSTFVGGSGNDTARALALDRDGSVYVAGTTSSTNFPTTPGAVQTALGGGTCPAAGNSTAACADGFLFKLKPDGSGLVYSTYLGGNSLDQARGVAVDQEGAAYVTGNAFSRNFPTTQGSIQPAFGGAAQCGPASARTACDDAFLVKLNPAGTAFVFSTFLGGIDRDQGNVVKVDDSGNAVVAGETRSTDFPATPGAYQITKRGGTCGTGADAVQCQDAFIVSVNPQGSAFNYSTLLGGDGDDRIIDLALDFASNAYVTGSAGASSFPTTPNASQRTFAGGSSDAFVSVIDSFGRMLVGSTLIGGNGTDIGEAIAVGPTGRVYLAGDTTSTNFPGRPAGSGTGVPVTYDIRGAPTRVP